MREHTSHNCESADSSASFITWGDQLVSDRNNGRNNLDVSTLLIPQTVLDWHFRRMGNGCLIHCEPDQRNQRMGRIVDLWIGASAGTRQRLAHGSLLLIGLEHNPRP